MKAHPLMATYTSLKPLQILQTDVQNIMIALAKTLQYVVMTRKVMQHDKYRHQGLHIIHTFLHFNCDQN